MKMKKCCRCQEEKPTSEFHRNKRSADGYIAQCKSCRKRIAAEFYEQTKEQILSKSKTYYQAHREERIEKTRWARLKREFGITREEYKARMAIQNGACAICGQKETASVGGTVKSLAVDHDHKTGRVRGLLCERCNKGLGLFRDAVDLMKRAIYYLTEAAGADQRR